MLMSPAPASAEVPLSATPIASTVPPLPWPARGPWLAALLAVVAWSWWGWGAGSFALLHLPHAGALGILVVAWRALGFVAEAGWYVQVWRAWGGRLPWARLACRIALLSTLDLLRLSLDVLALRQPAWAPWLALLAGPGALHHDTAHPLALGCATCGVLTVVRIAATATGQAQALQRGLAAPLALTVGTWAIGRLLLGFGLALARGPVGLT